jgi:formamidopyrimidine-DNA glycosylase
MMQYPDLAILPHQHEGTIIRCAMCGNLLWWVNAENREYHYCRKCKVVKFYCE